MAPPRKASVPAPRAPFDVHCTAEKLARARARLQPGATDLPAESARAILEFADSRRSAVSAQRELAYLEKLRLAALKLGADFLTPNKKTPALFLRAYGDAEIWTQITMRSVLYKFWRSRFEREDKEFPRWLRIAISKRNANHKDHNDVLTPEEVASLAEHAVNPRDRALIWTLYESGARVSEVLSCRVGDVETTDYGALRIHFPSGKTGRRTVPLFEAAVPNLLLWLRTHPGRDDKSAPLWTGIQQPGSIGRPIGYAMAVKAIQKAAERAGITKPVNPHNFRHSRASHVAQNPQVSTSVLEKFFGWQPGSPMAKTYVHLSGKEVEDALARAHGIDLGAVERPKVRLPLACARCSTPNDGDARFCVRCGGPLRLDAVQRAENERAELDQLAGLLEDPSVRAYLARRLAKRTAPLSPSIGA